MSKFIVLTSALILFNQLSYGQAKKNAGTPAEEVQKIEQLIQDYAKAIDPVDTTLASKLWLTTKEASFIQPRGFNHGWEEIKKDFYIGIMQKFFTERKLKIYNLSVQLFDNFAVVQFYWIFDAMLRDGGESLQTKGRESQVLKKTGEGWKIVHAHYSGMPVTGDREGF